MSRNRRSRHYAESFLSAARVTWLPWLIARVLVGGAYAASRYHNAHGTALNARGVAQTQNGLMAFDAGWYRVIAEHGYGGSSSASLRFFPLFPLVVRVFHLVVPLHWSLCVAVVANVAAFGAAIALYLLVAHDFHDKKLATVSIWLLCLGPASFVLVLGYAEGLFLLLAILTLLALRRQAWVPAALLGFAAALSRPVGIVLAVPALIEVAVAWSRSSSKNRAFGVVAVAGPLAGLLAFCLWCAKAFGNFWEPIQIQRQSGHHGGLADPIVVIAHALSNVLHGHHIGTALHVPWIAVSVLLLVVAFKKLPSSYAWFSLAVVVLALSGSNLDSFERYALSAFPLTIAAAMVMRSRRVAVVVLLGTASAMTIYCFLAFQGVYIP